MIDQFRDAVIAHISWRGRLLTAVDCGQAPNAEAVRSDCNCALGKWLYGEGRALANVKEYEVALREHKKFHETTASVIDLIDGGKLDEANASILNGAFRTQSKIVVVALSNLRRVVNGKTAIPDLPLARRSIRTKACLGSGGVIAAALVSTAPLAHIAAAAGASVSAIAAAAFGGGLFLVGAVLLFCLWIVNGVAKPIGELARAVLAIERNDFSVEVRSLHRWDEIGEMADAVQILVATAREKQRIEAEAGQIRKQAEEERERNALAATSAAERLSTVVEALAGALRRLACADMTYRIGDTFPEEYEQLRADFNDALEQLEPTLATVADCATAIESSAGEVSRVSDDLARRTEQQAAALEETAAAVNEITQIVDQTSKDASNAVSIVEAARAEALMSGDVVRKAEDAMSAIDGSAKRIVQIISVIDEIAFQTNLLALNAGVEAARAGAAGRGFAVVASEVRALAKRSAEAAKEIKGLISESSRQVEIGVKLVEKAGRFLKSFAAKVEEITGPVGEIAKSALRHSDNLSQVNHAVTEIDRVTQQNAAVAEEATAASHALADRATMLKELLAGVKTRPKAENVGNVRAFGSFAGRGANEPELPTTGLAKAG